MQDVINHPIVGHHVPQKRDNGYLNATVLCKAAGKKINDYRRLLATKAFLNELSPETGIPVSELIQVFKGGLPEFQGTWVHPMVAINLGQWLSPKFAVRVTFIVHDWMDGFRVRQAIDQVVGLVPHEWEKRFPDELYILIYELHGWEWKGRTKNTNQQCGRITNKWVWDVLAPGLREELEHRNPMRLGERRDKHHQYLTEQIGIPTLVKHIDRLIILMKGARSWEQFEMNAEHAFRKQREQAFLSRRKPDSYQDQMPLL